VFLAVLCAPAAVTNLSGSGPALDENREPAAMPVLKPDVQGIIEFPSRFERYFNDHFGLRSLLVRWYSIIKLLIQDKSSVKDVVFGRDDWLYFTGDGVLKDYCGTIPFSEKELELRKNLLEQKRDWLEEQGIAYLFVIPPNKHSIYPEYIPDEFTLIRGRTRLDQLVEYLENHSDIHILDLRKTLLDNKDRLRLYHRTDTHWNDAGAYFAYAEMIREIDRMLPCWKSEPWMLSDFEVVKVKGKGGDLAGLIKLEESIQEERILFRPERKRKADLIRMPAYLDRKWIFCNHVFAPFARENPDGNGTAVIFHDSFSMALSPFLGEHFRRAVFIWRNNPDYFLLEDVIEEEQPDIVVEEVLERFLGFMRTEQEFPAQALSMEFSASDETVLHMTTASSSAGDFSRRRDVSITRGPDGFIIDASGDDPRFELPDSRVPDTIRSIVRVDVTSPEDTQLQIFFQTEQYREFSLWLSRKASLKKGRNIVFLALPNIRRTEKLRLDPGTVSGEYVLHDLEIRGAGAQLDIH